ncbi:hypothetical protein GDO81_019928 [Engystomops pustulosus]|uniref:Uncharacterized protein n=1 Tax=Engystomops pustulosus TaxID=76066 RepID=A0AAV6ZF08_ENGPU|nr:hypothetical protein GDO81_019928 [Engystomops pustulosus]
MACPALLRGLRPVHGRLSPLTGPRGPRRGLHYVQGQSPEPRTREYFYYIDHQGQPRVLIQTQQKTPGDKKPTTRVPEPRKRLEEERSRSQQSRVRDQ